MTVTTVRVPTDRWTRFRSVAGSQVKSANDALNEAIELWLQAQAPPTPSQGSQPARPK